MKIALLTRNPKLYSHQRLIEAAQARGHEIVAVDYLRCYMDITSQKPELSYLGEKLEGFDAVIPRIAASHTFYGIAVVRQFEMMGVFRRTSRWRSAARATSCARCNSWRATASACRSPPSPTPPTRTNDVLDIVGGAPVVIKLLEGTQGIGVVLAETKKSAQSVIEAFRGADIAILVQEFIKEAGGSDMRVFVVGGKVVAAMKRAGAEGEFRSNLHRGGTAEEVKITPERTRMALKAAKSMGLNVAGVDMLAPTTGRW